MKIVGVDPGRYGAFCFLDPEAHTLQFHKMPFHQIKPGEKTKYLVDPVGVGSILYNEDIVRVYIEEVNARPEEGVVSTFNFGRAYGIILGAVGGLNHPFTLVRPAVWKKKLNVPAAKDGARFIASRLFPECASKWKNKNEDGVAEAALIAFYGMCDMTYQVKKKFSLLEHEE